MHERVLADLKMAPRPADATVAMHAEAAAAKPAVASVKTSVASDKPTVAVAKANVVAASPSVEVETEDAFTWTEIIESDSTVVKLN